MKTHSKSLKLVLLTVLFAICACMGVFMLTGTKVANAESTFDELGASVRVSSTSSGIRFGFGLPESKTGSGYTIGTLIIPKTTLGSNTLMHNSDPNKSATLNYREIVCQKTWLPSSQVPNAKSGYNYYNAALIDIPTSQYNTVVCARSYYKYNGTYYYSDVVERSIGYVASAALNDGFADVDDIVTNIVKAGFGSTTLTVDSANELIPAGETENFTATNSLGYLPVWSTVSGADASINKAGVLTTTKSEEVTVCATIGDTTETKTVYVMGDAILNENIGIVVNGWNQTSSTYITKSTNAGGDLVITARFDFNSIDTAKGGNTGTENGGRPGLVFRDNLPSQSFYEKMISEGYGAMRFNVAVGGSSASSVDDLYVFGRQLTTFPLVDGKYQVYVDLQHIVDNYSNLTRLGKGVQAYYNDYFNLQFLAWNSNGDDGSTWGAVRNYTFTISDPEFTVRQALTTSQIGINAYGWNQTGNASYFGIENSADGMVVTAKFSGSTTHYPTLALRNLYAKSYYEKLYAMGYTKVTFGLTVGGDNAADVSDLYVFNKKLGGFGKTSADTYAIVFDLKYIIDNYTNIGGIGTSVEGKNAQVDLMLLAWKSTDWTTRNYVFTFSNPIFAKGVLAANNIGVRVNGYNMNGNTTYLKIQTGTNGEMIIETRLQTASGNYKYPGVTLRNLYSKAYYQGLIDEGYTKLTFNIKVGGTNAATILDGTDDVKVFSTGKKIIDFASENGGYRVEIPLSELVKYYETAVDIGENSAQTGAYGNKHCYLLSWRNDTAWLTRDYIFTISDTKIV